VDRDKVVGLVLNEVDETPDAYAYRYEDTLPQAVGE
jgi:hypothetical protein